MSQANPKFANLNQHLVSNVPNLEEFRDFVKMINKMAKESSSIWKLGIRYRKPKEGHKYGYGGNLRCENANAFSIYIHDRRPYNQIPENRYRAEAFDAFHKLEEENKELKKKLAFYDNPYHEYRVSEIEDELFEIKDKMVEDYLVDPIYEELRREKIKKYSQLMEALAYHEESK